VIVHQAIRVAKPAIAGDDSRENAKKPLSVSVIDKDFLTGVTAGGEMIDGSWILES